MGCAIIFTLLIMTGDGGVATVNNIPNEKVCEEYRDRTIYMKTNNRAICLPVCR